MTAVDPRVALLSSLPAPKRRRPAAAAAPPAPNNDILDNFAAFVLGAAAPAAPVVAPRQQNAAAPAGDVLDQFAKFILKEQTEKRPSVFGEAAVTTTTDYRALRKAEFERQQKLKTRNFLEAFPTKALSAAELHALLPLEWALNTGAVPPALPELVRTPLAAGCAEFREVAHLAGGGVVRAERVENPYLWLLYQLRAIEFGLLFRSSEVRAFHGTKLANFEPICRNNFNVRLAGTSTGVAYGRGVYFARSSATSRQYTAGSNCMFFVRALQGRMCTGNGSTVLPQTGHDTTGTGEILVKYYDHQFYPQHIIHFS